SSVPQLRLESGAQGPLSPRADRKQLALPLSIFVVTGAVLMISCVNIANLLLVRSAARSVEVSMRLMLGASRWRLIRQLVTESLLVVAMGGLGGLLCAGWGRNFRAWISTGDGTVVEARLDPRALLFTAGLTLVTALAFGIWPALRATSRDRSRSFGIAV